MAWQRPTLSSLVSQVQSDFISRLTLIGAVLRRSMVYVLSRVLAGAAHMLYGNLQYLAKQFFPDVSDLPYLLRQGKIFDMAPEPPTFAHATATCTGTNGTIIPATTTILQRSDGAEYTVDNDATISSGTATIAVTAILAGSLGNLTPGVVLNFESPIAGVGSTATVASSVSDGDDIETTAGFRARVLERMQNPPQGGNATDYKAWAKQVAGVTRAWCYPLELGAGTVTLRFMRDNDDGIPSGGEVTIVQNYINALAPVTAVVTVVAPIAAAQNFTLHIVPSTSTSQAAVEAELADLILREGEPGGTIYLAQIETAVGNALGEGGNFTIATPSADIVNSTGYITTLGTVTFT